VTEPESSRIFLKLEITRTLRMFTGPARLEKLAIETYASTGNRRLKRQIGFAIPKNIIPIIWSCQKIGPCLDSCQFFWLVNVPLPTLLPTLVHFIANMGQLVGKK
jgi:hypothetical protein